MSSYSSMLPLVKTRGSVDLCFLYLQIGLNKDPQKVEPRALKQPRWKVLPCIKEMYLSGGPDCWRKNLPDDGQAVL